MSCDDPHYNSYFDRLPVELQVEVFEHCMDPYPRFSTRGVPLLICNVCSSWREVGQNTSKLWSRFEIIVKSDPTQDQNRLNALDLWLRRSRHHLLSIHVTYDPTGHVPDTRLAPILATLVPHARRLGDISFQTQSSSIALLQHFLSENLPGLQKVSIDLKGLWQSSFDIQDTRTPWGQLRELDLSFDYEQLPTLDRYLDILAQCSNLSHCSLTADCVFSRNLIEKVTLHRLRHLGLTLQSGPQRNANDLRSTAGSSLVSFLEQLELPNMSSLSLRWLLKGNHESDLLWSANDQSRFISIIGLFAPTLCSLSIAYFPFADHYVLECLRRTQRLSHLDLRFSLADKEGDPITDLFLSSMTASSIDASFPTYLPFLETFYIQCYGAHCSALRILNLIQSRWKPTSRGNQLRSFGLVSWIPISTPQTRDMSRVWSREGLKVTLEELLIR